VSAVELRLTPGAAVWRQVLRCEPDPRLLAASAGDVGAWLKRGPLLTQVLLEAGSGREAYALMVAPTGEPVWVPSAALRPAGEGGQALLEAPVEALGSRAELAFEPWSLPDDGAWIQTGSGDDAVLFQRWDPVTRALSGPPLRASAFDVLEKLERPDVVEAGEEPEVEARFIHAAGGRGASSAALIARFLGCGEGDEVPWAELVPSVTDTGLTGLEAEGLEEDARGGAAAPRSAPEAAAPPVLQRSSEDARARARDEVLAPSATVKASADAAPGEAETPPHVRSAEAVATRSAAQDAPNAPLGGRALLPVPPALPEEPAKSPRVDVSDVGRRVDEALRLEAAPRAQGITREEVRPTPLRQAAGPARPESPRSSVAEAPAHRPAALDPEADPSAAPPRVPPPEAHRAPTSRGAEPPWTIARSRMPVAPSSGDEPTVTRDPVRREQASVDTQAQAQEAMIAAPGAPRFTALEGQRAPSSDRGSGRPALSEPNRPIPPNTPAGTEVLRTLIHRPGTAAAPRLAREAAAEVPRTPRRDDDSLVAKAAPPSLAPVDTHPALQRPAAPMPGPSPAQAALPSALPRPAVVRAVTLPDAPVAPSEALGTWLKGAQASLEASRTAPASGARLSALAPIPAAGAPAPTSAPVLKQAPARPAVARAVEIGEIFVEIGDAEPPRPPPRQTGSLIAAIPSFRIAGGRR
jgi:hypothetical protein